MGCRGGHANEVDDLEKSLMEFGYAGVRAGPNCGKSINDRDINDIN